MAKFKYIVNLKDLAYFAVTLIIFTASYTDIFWFFRPIPLAIYASYGFVCVVCLFLLQNMKRKLIFYDSRYYLVLLFFSSILIISFLHGTLTEHSIRYLIWFLFIFIVYGVIGKFVIDASNVDLRTYFWLEFSIVITCVAGLHEWGIKNGYIPGFSVLDMLIRGETEFISRLLDHIRLRSTVEEAGHFGLFLNAFVPLTLLRKRSSKIWFTFYISVVIVAYALTMSLATWGVMLISIIFAFLFVIKKGSKEFITGSILISMVVLFLVILIYNTDNQLTSRIGNKEDVSYVHRTFIYSTLVNRMAQADIATWLFGYGPASFIDSVDNNPISWYLFFLHDLGICAFFGLIFLGYYILRKILLSSCSEWHKMLLLLSPLTLMLHYTVTANFWHPWLWIAFPLIFNFIRLADATKEIL